MTQRDAGTFCETRGDHLLTFKTLAKFNAFQEIKSAWIDQGKLNGEFWISLKKNEENTLEQFWHDGSLNTNNLGFNVDLHSDAELCYRFSLDLSNPGLPTFRDYPCSNSLIVVCERDLGLCEFETFPDMIYGGSSTKENMGEISMEQCMSHCVNYDVTGKECFGVEATSTGTCSLLTGTKIFVSSVPTSDSVGNTLYIKRCYQSQLYGNPSTPVTFQVYDISLDWDNTRTFCEFAGQTMVKLDTRAKMEAFSVLYKEWSTAGKIYNDIWIGLRDRNDSGTADYIWYDEQPLATITNWAGDEPNNLDFELCVRLVNNQQLIWRTRECWRKYQVVCEIASPATCSFTDIPKVPQNSPSVSTSSVTEGECQNQCLTTASGGKECTIYTYYGSTCNLYMGTQTLGDSEEPSKEKNCFFSEAQKREVAVKRFSVYERTMTKSNTDTFCTLIGEEPLVLNNSAAYDAFIHILQNRADLPRLGEIWVTPASPSLSACDVITTSAVPQLSSQSCNLEAQIVCLSAREDCAYVDHASSSLTSVDFLSLSGFTSDQCQNQCKKTIMGDRICAGVVHDGNTGCQLIMRSDTYSSTPPNLVTEEGKTLSYLSCYEAVFMNQSTTSREYSVHGLKFIKGLTEEFCTQIGRSALVPATLPELSAAFHAVSQWGDLGVLDGSQHVWTALRKVYMSRSFETLMRVEDNADTVCVALNHVTSTWTPLTCTVQAHVVCQKDKGTCTMEEYPERSLSDTSRRLVIPNLDLEACKIWCNDLAATYAECVSVEFDGSDCIAHFADSVYVTTTPTMTASSSTVFIRRCYKLVTPDFTNQLSYNFVMFDVLLTHTASSDACTTLGKEMLKLDNESSTALSTIVNRTNNIWLGLVANLVSYTWTDGQAPNWTNWQPGTSGLVVDDQCVALDKTSPNLVWNYENCNATNFALCNSGTGECSYTSNPGKKLSTAANSPIIKRSTAAECMAVCTGVRVGTALCRAVSIQDTNCYLDMGEEMHQSDPEMVDDLTYNTFISSCNKVEIVPYPPPSVLNSDTTTVTEVTSVSSDTIAVLADTTATIFSEDTADQTTVMGDTTATIFSEDTADQTTVMEDTTATIFREDATDQTTVMEETSVPALEPSNTVDSGSGTALDSRVISDAQTIFPTSDTQTPFPISYDTSQTAEPHLTFDDVTPAQTMSVDNGERDEMLTMDMSAMTSVEDAGLIGNEDTTGTSITDGDLQSLVYQMPGDSSVTHGHLDVVGRNGDRFVFKVCLCRCSIQLPDTPSLMSVEVRGIHDDLLLDKKNLSSYLRTKMSVPNKRRSAIVMGTGLGTGIMVTLLIIMFVLDLDYIVMFVKMCKTGLKH